MSKIGYIYALCDPDTAEVRYVGQTVHRPEQRLAGHVLGASYGSRTRSATWIRTLPCEPHLRVLERNVPRAKLNEREAFWIRALRQDGAVLTNSATVAGVSARA